MTTESAMPVSPWPANLGWSIWLRWAAFTTLAYGVASVAASTTLQRAPLATPLAVAAGLALIATLQWWILREHLPHISWGGWVLALIMGYVVGSLAVGLVVMAPLALGTLRNVADQLGGPGLGVAAKLAGGAVLGAVIGTAQWLVLRRRVRTAAWWIVASASANAASTVVPSIAALGAAVAPSAAVIADRFIYGAVVGSLTGFALLWLLRRQRATGVALMIVGLAFPTSARAQNVAPSDSALRIFLDCSGPACDFDFLRTELGFVNHVRDRQDAQVYVLVATQTTAGGGQEFTANFIGQHEFRGQEDVLRSASGPSDSQDQLRRRLAQLLMRGLVRYLNSTSLGERLQVTYLPAATGQQTPGVNRDRWNHWTFSTAINGSLDGEESTNSMSIAASLSANRTTEAWKIVSSVQSRYNRSSVDIGEAGRVKTSQRNYGVDNLVVKSLGSRWSLGARATLISSVFLNQALTLRFGPAIEYNVFPYSESTRRQLTLQYSTGATSFRYVEETIFGRTAETLLDERLLVSLRLRQPWGSVSTSVEASHYFQDPSKRRGILANSIDLSLFKGVTLVTFAGMELVRDQLYLPKRNASVEEILLRQRQLATSFRYFASLGIAYTFGSRFANVVNPRFAGSVGGTAISQ